MKLYRRELLAGLLVAIIFVPPLRAEIDAVPSVEYLTRMSDAIVVGTGTLMSSNGTQTTIDIDPIRIVKGEGLEPNKPIEITINSQNPNCSINPKSQPVTAIWFLESHADGTFTFTSSPKSQSCHPFQNDYEMPAGPLSSKWAYSNKLGAKDKLAYELAASIEDHQGEGPYGLVLNSQLLFGVSKDIGMDIYSKLASDPDSNTRFVGILGLIKLGDLKTLQYLNANLPGLEQTPKRQTLFRNNQRTAITYGIEETGASTESRDIGSAISGITSTDNAVVTEIGTVLQNSTTQSTRYAAARALQNIHTALAVSYLAPLLNNQDPQLRALAIGGLSCFSNAVSVIDPRVKDDGLNLAASGPFKTMDTLQHFAMGKVTIAQRESYYLDYWQSWWLSNRSAVEAKAPNQ